MPTPLNLDLYNQERAARGLEPEAVRSLDLAVAFDESKHPRLHGKFTKAIGALKPNESLSLPDGISVRRRGHGLPGYESKLTKSGFGRTTHDTAAEAATHVLDKSAQNEHSKALGGEIHYKDAKSALDAMDKGKAVRGEHFQSNRHSQAEADQLFAKHAASGLESQVGPVGPDTRGLKEQNPGDIRAIVEENMKRRQAGQEPLTGDEQKALLAKKNAGASGDGQKRDGSRVFAMINHKTGTTSVHVGPDNKDLPGVKPYDDHPGQQVHSAEFPHADAAKEFISKHFGEDVAKREIRKAKNNASRGRRKAAARSTGGVQASAPAGLDPALYQAELERARLNLATFDESKHPRVHGKFSKVMGHLEQATGNKPDMRTQSVGGWEGEARVTWAHPGEFAHRSLAVTHAGDGRYRAEERSGIGSDKSVRRAEGKTPDEAFQNYLGKVGRSREPDSHPFKKHAANQAPKNAAEPAAAKSGVGRSSSGGLRNFKAMGDTKLNNTTSDLIGEGVHNDLEAAKALHAEHVRRGTDGQFNAVVLKSHIDKHSGGGGSSGGTIDTARAEATAAGYRQGDHGRLANLKRMQEADKAKGTMEGGWHAADARKRRMASRKKEIARLERVTGAQQDAMRRSAGLSQTDYNDALAEERLFLAMGHEKTIGSKGKDLFNIKGAQLPAYIQHVYNDIVEGGHPPGSSAYRLAVGIVRNWKDGHDGHGNKVSAETQTKAAAAWAEWESLKAKAKADN